MRTGSRWPSRTEPRCSADSAKRISKAPLACTREFAVECLAPEGQLPQTLRQSGAISTMAFLSEGYMKTIRSFAFSLLAAVLCALPAYAQNATSDVSIGSLAERLEQLEQ